jgi:hypothetical protein
VADSYYDEIGFGDESIGSDRTERYKGRKGYTDRIGFVFPTRIQKAKVHYKDKYIICSGGLCCEKLGPPKFRLGAVIVQYSTDKRGRPEKPFNYTIKHWVFSGKKYEDLREVNSEWPLAKHDLKVNCIEEGFQQLKFVACKESLWQQNDKLKAQIMREAEAALKGLYLGSKMDNEALREHLGIESSPDDGFDATDDNDFDDMLEGMDLGS